MVLDKGVNPCARRPEFGFDAFRACYEADHSSLTTGDRKGTVVHALTDLDGDRVADLVVYKLEGRGVFSVHSTYEVHFGMTVYERRTVFRPEPDAAIPSEDVQIVIDSLDFDGDRRADMMLTSLHIGLFEVLGGLITRSMSLDLEFCRMEGGTYPVEPAATRKIRIDPSPGESGKQGASYGSVMLGDVNGDVLPDLLIGRGRRELHVFAGVTGPELFARQPRKVKVPIANDEQYTRLTDLDRDGRQDVLAHRPSTAKEPNRVTVLLAR